MNKLIIAAILTALSATAFADNYVRGHVRKDGTYVQGYYRSDSNSNRYDNKSSQTYGGSKRDEFSSGTGSTNKSNSSYGWRDNDQDGVSNNYDREPDSKGDR